MTLKTIITLSIILSLFSGCGDDTENASNSAGTQDNLSTNTATDLSKIIKNAKPWQGSASGYIVDSNTPERIKTFVVLGQLFAAADIYRNKARNIQSEIKNGDIPNNSQQTNLATSFAPDVLASYAAIDAKVQEKLAENDHSLSIQEAITALLEPQQILDVSNPEYDLRDKRIAAEKNISALTNRLELAVLAYFPSRHEFLLASSALIRVAGDKTALGVSADGIILDADLVDQARSFIDRSEKLDPRNISYCDAQRKPMREHSSSITDVLNNLLPLAVGEKLSVTASDVYALARQAQTAGEQLPMNDADSC